MDALKEIHPEINQYINLDCLVPHLNKYGILTETDYFHLTNFCKARREKVDYLFQMLPSKGAKAVHKFVTALKEEREHTGHEVLCELLVQMGIKI